MPIVIVHEKHMERQRVFWKHSRRVGIMRNEEIDALGVSCDLRTAARALGVSKSTAYALAQKGEFPVRVVRIGSRYVVPTADLRALLGLGSAA